VSSRDRLPTITVQADIVPGIKPRPSITTGRRRWRFAIDAPGYRLEEGGAVEQSARANGRYWRIVMSF